MKPDKSHALNRAFEKQAKRERLEKAKKALANKEYAKAKALLREDVEAPLAGPEAGEPQFRDSSETAVDERRPSKPEVAGSSPARGSASSPVASTHPDGTDPWNCDIPWTEHGLCEDKRRVAIGLLPQNHVEDDGYGFVRRSSRLLGPHRPPRTAEERIAAGRKTWDVIAELRARREQS